MSWWTLRIALSIWANYKYYLLDLQFKEQIFEDRICSSWSRNKYRQNSSENLICPHTLGPAVFASLGKTFERGFNRNASLRSSGRPIESKHAMCWVTGIHLTRSLGNSNANWSLKNGGICKKPACLSTSWKPSDKGRGWGKPALGAWVLKLLLSCKQ